MNEVCTFDLSVYLAQNEREDREMCYPRLNPE